MASIFLTGATGYVGGHVLDALARRGHRIACLVRSAGTASRFARNGHAAVVGSLSDSSDWMATAMGCDAIIHTAFPYDNSGEELPDIETAFARGFLGALTQPTRSPQFIYTSSLFLFGAMQGCKVFSELDAPPLDPTAWRLSLEKEVLGHGQDQQVSTVVRLGWVYGGDGGTLEQAVSDASIAIESSDLRVPLIHVDDAAALYVLAIERRITGVLHACEPTPVKWREVIERVAPDKQLSPRADAQGVSILFDYDRPAEPLRSVACGWTPLRQFKRDYRPRLSRNSGG